MNMNSIMQWQTLIFLVPFALSSLLLLLSSLKMGHREGGHHAAAPHTGTVSVHHASAPAHTSAIKLVHTPNMKLHLGKPHVSRQGQNRDSLTLSTQIILQITGLDKAPLPVLLELFFMIWGLFGLGIEQYTAQSAKNPDLKQMLLPMLAALAAGLIGARVCAGLLARLIPQEESLDVSHNALFGLTGTIAFSANEGQGRIQVYDAHGTLHDERCRTAQGGGEIPKGRMAMIADVAPDGCLIVEEVSSPALNEQRTGG